MPLLAGLFISMFSQFAAFLGSYMARKYAVGLAALAVLFTITAAMYGALSGLLNGLNAVLPNWPGMETAVWVAAPPILPVAVGACIAADITVAVWQYNKQQMKFLMLG